MRTMQAPTQPAGGANARLSAVGAHLAAAAEHPAQPEDGQQPPPPAAGPDAGPARMLSAAEIAAFVSQGYHCVDTRGEISAEFHRSFTTRSREIHDRPREDPLQDVGFLELEADIAEVLRAPSVRGALASLLGNDFTMACAWAEDNNNGGMMGNHHSSAPGADQAYHKDGIHTPASVVRDIKPRGLILMYYPNGASLEQGPTAIVPGSNHFMPDADLIVGLGPMPEPHAARDEWLLKQANSFGDAGRLDFRVVVPPGSVLLTDYHIYHRASRSAGPDAPWRPNVKLGAARISEPTAPAVSRPSWGSALLGPQQQPEAHGATPAVHSAVWDWLAGGRPGQQPAAAGGADMAAVERDKAVLRESASDVDRVEAAHRLAVAAGGAAPAPAAVAALEALTDAYLAGVPTSKRAVAYGGAHGDGGDVAHRAAKYGLCAAGPAATEAVAAALAAAVSAQNWAAVPSAAHVLGQCSAAGDEAAVAVLASALSTALSELAAYTDAAVAAGTVEAGYVAPAGNDPRPKGYDEENDMFTHARRVAAAELCCALGLAGHRACRVDAVGATLSALDALLLVLTAAGEPGCAFRADGLWNNQIRSTAGTALLRISSDPGVTTASMPLLGGVRGRDRLVKGMVVEGMRRARLSAAASGSGVAAVTAVARALEQAEWPWQQEGFQGAEDDRAAVYVPFDRGAAEAHLHVAAHMG
eukprot:SAG22_NODE_169_length_16721_cov_6.494104_9_plen_699_part_00